MNQAMGYASGEFVILLNPDLAEYGYNDDKGEISGILLVSWLFHDINATDLIRQSEWYSIVMLTFFLTILSH